MYEDYEIKKRTYGTPENIRIRKIYNQILNRPENYGMEDLFPTINQWNGQPFGMINLLPNGVQQQNKNSQENNINNISLWLNQIISQGYNAAKEMSGAVYDMSNQYVNMRRDRTKRADDYFHCLANYKAAERGALGAKTAEILGDYKEIIVYFRNRYIKKMSQQDAYRDYQHDRFINKIGRQQENSGLYSNAKNGCNIFRVNGINEIY